MPILANPAGLFALLALPALVAIYCLQLRKKIRPCSTLFLLAAALPPTRSGSRFTNLVTSRSFWFQCLAITLLSLALSRPEFPTESLHSRVAIVIDDSASMSAFRKELAEILPPAIQPFQSDSATLTLIALPASPDAPIIYSGNSIPALADSLRAIPDSSRTATPPESAINRARQLVGSSGTVIYVTDTPIPPRQSGNSDILFISIGQPKPNTAIVSLETSRDNPTHWNAIIANFSPTPQLSSWWLEFPDSSTSTPQPINLAPGQLLPVSGKLDSLSSRATLRISPDALAIDNSAPILPSQPKPLTFHIAIPQLAAFSNSLQRLIPASSPATSPDLADFSLASAPSADFPRLALPRIPAIISLVDPVSAPLSGPFLAEIHPLVNDLNWQHLIANAPKSLPDISSLPNGFIPLLWKNSTPLISWNPQNLTLVLHFDLASSNFLKIPAGAILLHRFAQLVRSAKLAPESAQFLVSQPLNLSPKLLSQSPANLAPSISSFSANSSLKTSSPITPARFPSLRAPDQPGFFEVSLGKSPILTGSAQFCDPAESNLLNCLSIHNLNTHKPETSSSRQSSPLAPLLVLFAIAALICAWWPAKTARNASSASLP